MRRWISALVVAAFTALVALLGVPVPSAIAVPSAQPFPAYTYDGHDRSALSTTSTPARGPPAAYDHFTSDDAVDRPSRSASARPNRTMASPAIGYDHPTALVRGARATDMTQEHAQLSDGPSVVFDLVGVAANSGRVVANACRTNSFTGDTLVLMADGSRKPIKDVKLGDEVIATDPETGESGPRKVTDLIRHGGLHTMVALRLSDGSTIDATDQHPFWVESRGEWVDAIDLRPGDIVLTADGHRLTVASLGISEQDLTAYNLTVADLHTYFAGESAVLVHNTGCTNIADLPASAVRNLTEDSGYAFSRLSQNHGVSRIEFREQIHMIKRNENLPADFNLSFGPTGDVWNPRTGELIGSIVHGG